MHCLGTMPWSSSLSLWRRQCCFRQVHGSDSDHQLGKSVTHTHTCLTALFPELPGWVGTRKVKPIWIFPETVSGSGISWAICKSAPCSTQITTPAPHHSVFLQDRCPSCRPTNSVKALKARAETGEGKSFHQSLAFWCILGKKMCSSTDNWRMRDRALTLAPPQTPGASWPSPMSPPTLPILILLSLWVGLGDLLHTQRLAHSM